VQTASWSPEWSDGEPQIRILDYSTPGITSLIERSWKRDGHGNVPTKLRIVGSALPNKRAIELNIPIGTCGLSPRSPGMRLRYMIPLNAPMGSYVRVQFEANSKKLMSPPLAVRAAK
jgi:hypothetical protein